MIEGRIQLPDGRSLSYADWGPPSAPVTIYCHGFPGSRLELSLALQYLKLEEIPVRIVALDRPGFGNSTFQPDREILDWPNDVATAADRLGIDTFSVLGISAGSPFALACGYALPERVSRVGVVVGVAPVEATAMDQANIISGMSRFRSIRRFQLSMLGMAFRKGREDRVFEQMPATMGEPDQKAFATAEVRDWFRATMQEAFSQGVRGAVHEANLYRKPWGFDLEEVMAATTFWYGHKDKTVPADVGLWMSMRLPLSRYSLWPEHGHFSWMQSAEALDVISTMAGQGQTTSKT